MCFTGFDAYKKLLAVPEINYVILATPPHFRPVHLKAAIEAGKHVFMEKPVAVDVAGREDGDGGRRTGQAEETGHCGRHAAPSPEELPGNHQAHPATAPSATSSTPDATGTAARSGSSSASRAGATWNGSCATGTTSPGSRGDHIVEQHVHNLDIMNWVLGRIPSGRWPGWAAARSAPAKSTATSSTTSPSNSSTPDGVRMFSQCRQINGCENLVEEAVVGSKGTSNCKNSIKPQAGKAWRFRGTGIRTPISQEHEDLIASIRAGSPINEAQAIAESTMTGIMGREAVYSGKALEWDAAMQSTRRLGPEKYEFGPFPVPEVAKPGHTSFRSSS